MPFRFPELTGTVSPRSRSRRARPSILVAVALVLAVSPWPAAATAAEIITVRSAPLAVYDAALGGFKEAYRSLAAPTARKTVAPIRYTDYMLGELEPGSSPLPRSGSADLIVTVGQRALDRVAGTHGIPIVHLLASRVPDRLAGRNDVYGVSMEVSPEQWVEAFARAMPGQLRVGVVHDPRRTGTWLRRAVLAAGLYEVTIRAETVNTPRAVPGALARLRGRVDALWMIPDLTVVTPETVALLAEFSLEQRVPVFSFAEKYLTKGATAALLHSPRQIGQQGARLAARVTGAGNGGAGTLEQLPAPQVVMRLNPSLAFRFLPGLRDDH